jgi:uncharacterized protein
MTARHHDMPREQFEALARGEGGTDAIEKLVAAEHSKHRILIRAVVDMAKAAGRPEDRLVHAGYELLEEVWRHDPDAADVVIRYPCVGAWALHTYRGDQAIPGASPGWLAAVAAAAAIRAELPAEIEVPVVGGAVTLPTLGAAIADGPTAIVRTSPGTVRSGGGCVAIRPGAPGWQELRVARVGALDVAVDDLDPFRMPASDGESAGRLTAAQVAQFTATLRAGWDVLDPARAEEIAALVRVIVPYEAPPGGLVSTTSPEVFGTVAMSLPPDPYSCAEILIHETQHIKLCALLDLVRLTERDQGQRFYAPWRPDPRPASGLLQGTYAFLGVAGFWREQRLAAPRPDVRRRAEQAFTRWRDAAALGAETLLASGQLTADGKMFTAEMARVLRDWQREPVSDDALADARHQAEQHHTRWLADNEARASHAVSGR